MTTATQPKPNPLPAILVYGTPSGPALTQASWFRAEDKEAVKAAAEALKFSVIELQTDADRALAAGAHEGVLKGSGRMIVGSVSAEVYRRIEEHVRKGASAPDPSKPETAAAATTKPASEQNTNIRRGGCDLAGTLSCNPGCAGDRQAGQRHRSRDPAGRREGPGRLLEREARVRGLLARDRQADRPRRVHPRVVRRPGISGVQEPAPGHRRSPSRVPRLGQVTRGRASSQTPWGGLRVAPLLSAHAQNQARAIPTPNLKRPSHDQHHRVHRRTHPRPQRRFPPHLRRRHGHDHRRRRSPAGSINVARCSRRSAPSTPSPTTTIPTASTTSARSTRAASAASGRSTTTTAPPSWARPIPLIPPSPRAS